MKANDKRPMYLIYGITIWFYLFLGSPYSLELSKGKYYCLWSWCKSNLRLIEVMFSTVDTAAMHALA